MLRTTRAATAFVLAMSVGAACGDDDGDLLGEGGGAADVDPTDEPADEAFDEPADEAFDETFDEPEARDLPEWDGPNDLDLDFDELRAVVSDAFDGADTGRGSSNMWPAPIVHIEVGAGDLTDGELLAGCEQLTDWLFERPEDEAVGPVIVEVELWEREADREDNELALVNERLIPREQRGSCEPA